MISQTQQMVYRLSNLDTQQQKVTYQMSTKKELQYGSDDSVLYARIVSVDDKIRTYEGLQSQVEKTTLQNNTSDSSLSEIKKILDFVKQELLKANTSTTTADGIAAIASSISGIKENIYQLANTQIEGEYLFAGSDSSIKPFEKNATTGKITYQGNNQLRKIAVEEDSYREKGVTGFDMMMYPSSTAYKGKTLTFKDTDRIIDQNRNEWKLNSPTNNTLTKYDLNGNATSTTLSVTGTSPTLSVVVPSTDGTKFEAKTNIFDFIDNTVNALKKVDSSGNPITDAQSKTLIGNSLTEFDKAFDAVNVAHADLGGKNQVFEISLERINSKLTQYNVLSQEISGADLTKVAMEAKALELTYTALYSTISKTNQLSLVNFLN
jgi:flagellar hook-associated protein 3 FlgL